LILRQLEYLCALAEHRHFGRAAASCHVSQPALSVAIRKLESELDLELVHRDNRRAEITPQGEDVLRWAREVLAGVAGLSSEASRLNDQLSGTLRIGVIPTALPLIARITSPLLTDHPGVELEVRSMAAPAIVSAVEGFAIDAGITYIDERRTRGVRATQIFEERYVFLSAGERKARKSIAWRELDGVALCMLSSEMRNRRIIENALRSVGAKASARVETDSISALLSFAVEGWSSVVSQSWLDLYGVPPGMRALPLVEPDLRQPIGVVCRDSDHLPPLVTSLLADAALAPEALPDPSTPSLRIGSPR
jgi:DNA-binding transcriptional LysR family regulator